MKSMKSASVQVFVYFFICFILTHCSIKTAPSKMYNPVIAHRGAWKTKNHPENSIAALEEAIQLKCQGSEFDIHMTKDSILVINHDDNFFGKKIEHHTYAELSKMKLSNGEELPLLEVYLKKTIPTLSLTRPILEIKPSINGKEKGELIASQVYRLVKKLKLQRKVSYISFDIHILRKLIALDKKADTQYLNGDKSPKELKALGIKGLDYHYTVYTEQHPEWIDQAKQLGLVLNVWTVNKKEDLDFFIAKKFEQITTNEPELLFKVLHSKN